MAGERIIIGRIEPDALGLVYSAAFTAVAARSPVGEHEAARSAGAAAVEHFVGVVEGLARGQAK